MHLSALFQRHGLARGLQASGVIAGGRREALCGFGITVARSRAALYGSGVTAAGSRAALWSSGVTTAGSRAALCGSVVTAAGSRAGLSRRSLSVLKSLSWPVPGPPSRCLSSSGPSSPGRLIYKGNLSKAVRGVKAFSYSSSGISLALMPHILLNTPLGSQGLAVQAVFCGVIGFFTFLSPVILHLLAKGYVVRLYHDPEKDLYTAITYSIFLREKRTVFHQAQVRIPDVSKMFTTFYADRMGLLVNPGHFSASQDYIHLMGYDKPFHFSPEHLDES